MKTLNDIEFLETLKQPFLDAKTGREATFNNAVVNRISDLQKKLDKKGILVEDGITQLKYESGVRYRVSYSHKNYYFYTLEEARAFRDGTLTLKDKELVQKELNNISKELDIKEFPYNFLDALLKDSKVEYDINYVLDNLDKNLIYIFENFNFTKKEGKVLCERFIHLRTLEETGKIIGLTRERIRQIEIRTIRKLKHPSRLKIILYGPESLSLNEDIKKLREQISAEKNRLIKEYELLLKNGLTDKEKEEFMNSKEYYLHEPISTMNLTVRSYNCLVRANIATINDLVSLSKEELLNIRNLGRKSFKEIVEMVENAYNLEFRKP